MSTIFARTFFAAALFFPASAFAACVQSDVGGSWRFEFNAGGNTSNSRTYIISCVIDLAANGTISPQSCIALWGQTDTAAFEINTPRTFRVNNKCEVKLGGEPVFTNDIGLHMGTTIYSVNDVRLTMSADKQIMLGYAMTNGIGNASVMAVKRAAP